MAIQSAESAEEMEHFANDLVNAYLTHSPHSDWWSALIAARDADIRAEERAYFAGYLQGCGKSPEAIDYIVNRARASSSATRATLLPGDAT
jgi:hypothetical protein